MILTVEPSDLTSIEAGLCTSLAQLIDRSRNQVVIKMGHRTGNLVIGHYAKFDSDYLPLVCVKYNARGALVFQCTSDLCHPIHALVPQESTILYETFRDLVVKIATTHLGYAPHLIEKGK